MLKRFFSRIGNNLKTMAIRFPSTLLSLAFVSVLISRLIEGTSDESQLIQLFFAGIFAAFLSLAGVFLAERFAWKLLQTLLLHIGVIGSAVLYYFLFTTPENSLIEVIRLLVFCFALLALAIYFPAMKNTLKFGKEALVHFKSAFIALLYGAVLFLGLLMIYLAIDLLLIKLDEQLPIHIANIVFLFFTPAYYLSLLPKFHAPEHSHWETESGSYPRFLNILVSYILIPLITVFTAVLAIYAAKILITRVWPVGQIGPMVLGYSASGFIIYILSVDLQDKWASSFKRIYPIALIPLVALQLVSCYIRIKAYGITESRYYVVLFGIFSLLTAMYLIFSKLKQAKMIVLLAAIFATISILPPIDAFSVSARSQTARVEEILLRNEMLSNNKVTPKNTLPAEDKAEITNIIQYMASMGHTKKLSWLPEEYRNKRDLYSEFNTIFGFMPYYAAIPAETSTYIYVRLSDTFSIDITNYSRMMICTFNSENPPTESVANFRINETDYTATITFGNKGEPVLNILDANQTLVLSASTDELLSNIDGQPEKSELPADPLTLTASANSLTVTLIFRELNFEIQPSGEYRNLYAAFYLLVG